MLGAQANLFPGETRTRPRQPRPFCSSPPPGRGSPTRNVGPGTNRRGSRDLGSRQLKQNSNACRRHDSHLLTKRKHLKVKDTFLEANWSGSVSRGSRAGGRAGSRVCRASSDTKSHLPPERVTKVRRQHGLVNGEAGLWEPRPGLGAPAVPGPPVLFPPSLQSKAPPRPGACQHSAETGEGREKEKGKGRRHDEEWPAALTSGPVAWPLSPRPGSTRSCRR